MWHRRQEARRSLLPVGWGGLRRQRCAITRFSSISPTLLPLRLRCGWRFSPRRFGNPWSTRQGYQTELAAIGLPSSPLLTIWASAPRSSSERANLWRDRKSVVEGNSEEL